jgi:Fe-S cluster biogenesis protein NfuA
MFIQTEQTPNPNSLKFIPGEVVMTTGTAEFSSVEAARRSPLAARLFKIDGVKNVFFGSEFISVTKTEDFDWDVIKPSVLAGIMEHYLSGQPILREAQAAATSASEDSDIVKEIKELIESRVRPAVAQDGGDIEFDRFENGVVYLHLRGACQGCPSSTLTLKSGIENMLKYYIPEVQSVEPASDAA